LHDNVAGFIERTSNLPQKQARPRSPMTDCASER
jgi:hypothetical protein